MIKNDPFYFTRSDLSEEEKLAIFNRTILEAIDQADRGDVFSPEEVLNFLQSKIETRLPKNDFKNAS